MTPLVQQTPPLPVSATGVPPTCSQRAVPASNAVAVLTGCRYRTAWDPCTTILGDWSRQVLRPTDGVGATVAPAGAPATTGSSPRIDATMIHTTERVRDPSD